MSTILVETWNIFGNWKGQNERYLTLRQNKLALCILSLKTTFGVAFSLSAFCTQSGNPDITSIFLDSLCSYLAIAALIVILAKVRMELIRWCICWPCWTEMQPCTLKSKHLLYSRVKQLAIGCCPESLLIIIKWQELSRQSFKNHKLILHLQHLKYCIYSHCWERDLSNVYFSRN